MPLKKTLEYNIMCIIIFRMAVGRGEVDGGCSEGGGEVAAGRKAPCLFSRRITHGNNGPVSTHVAGGAKRGLYNFVLALNFFFFFIVLLLLSVKKGPNNCVNTIFFFYFPSSGRFCSEATNNK